MEATTKARNQLTVLSSKYIVLDKKSIPMVACNKEKLVHNAVRIQYNSITYFKQYQIGIIALTLKLQPLVSQENRDAQRRI